jgi:hypothetical protein
MVRSLTASPSREFGSRLVRECSRTYGQWSGPVAGCSSPRPGWRRIPPPVRLRLCTSPTVLVSCERSREFCRCLRRSVACQECMGQGQHKDGARRASRDILFRDPSIKRNHAGNALDLRPGTPLDRQVSSTAALEPLPPPPDGQVTLHLNEVDVRQALEILSRSHSLNILIAPELRDKLRPTSRACRSTRP